MVSGSQKVSNLGTWILRWNNDLCLPARSLRPTVFCSAIWESSGYLLDAWLAVISSKMSSRLERKTRRHKILDRWCHRQPTVSSSSCSPWEIAWKLVLHCKTHFHYIPPRGAPQWDISQHNKSYMHSSVHHCVTNMVFVTCVICVIQRGNTNCK